MSMMITIRRETSPFIPVILKGILGKVRRNYSHIIPSISTAFVAQMIHYH